MPKAIHKFDLFLSNGSVKQAFREGTRQEILDYYHRSLFEPDTLEPIQTLRGRSCDDEKPVSVVAIKWAYDIGEGEEELADALRQVVACMDRNDTSAEKGHPWIPGADAKVMRQFIQSILNY